MARAETHALPTVGYTLVGPHVGGAGTVFTSCRLSVGTAQANDEGDMKAGPWVSRARVPWYGIYQYTAG